MRDFKIAFTLLFSIVYAIQVSFAQETVNGDLFELELKDQGEIGALLIKTQNNLGANLDTAYYYADRALKKSIKVKDSALMAHSYYLLANHAYFIKDYEKTEKYVNACLKIADQKNYRRFQFESHRLNGAIATSTKSTDKALEEFQKALKIAEATGNDELQVLILDDMGVLHTKNGDYELARGVFLEAYDIVKNHEDNPEFYPYLSHIYSSLSVVCRDFDEGLKFAEKSIELAKMKDNKEKLLDAEFSKAKVFHKYKKYNQAIVFLEDIIEQAEASGFKRIVYYASMLLTKCLLQENQYAYAKKVFNPLAQEYEVYRDKMPLNKLDSLAVAVYSKTNDGTKLDYHLEKYLAFLKHTIESSRSEAYLEYSKKYETDKKIQENELLKKDNQIKALEVNKQKTSRNVFIGATFLIVMISIYLMYRYKQKQKIASTLAEQNRLINIQKIQLEEANENKQKLFSIVAHDLINPFNAILGYTKLLNEDYDSFDETERKTFVNIIDKYATNNYKLTKTLLDWSKAQQNKIKVQKETINCAEVVHKSLAPYMVLADKKKIKVNINVPPEASVMADYNMMQTVIGNLFVNAIKYTPINGHVNINLEQNNDGMLKFIIEDNGIGMTQEQLNNLFDISKITTVQGTEDEKGNGLGLILCKELMNLQNGTLQLMSKLNQGSKAVITI